MNAEGLLKVYEQIGEAPDAVGRLRQFVLDLAVRGKLVEQDGGDEPAQKFLEKVRVEKARLQKAGVLKRSKALKPVKIADHPFDLPASWRWARLGDLIDLVSGQHLQPAEYSEDQKDGIPYITGPSDFGDKKLVIRRYALVRKAVATKGQLLLTVKGSGVGKTTVCDLDEVAISRQLMALTPILLNAGFLELVAHGLATKLQDEARSLIPGIARDDVNLFVMAVPPLAEQHRIVAKVDELMGLCDRLEAARVAREEVRDKLTAASLARLTAPDAGSTDIPDQTTEASQTSGTPPAAPAFHTHARFALDALPALTSRPDQIKTLRQTILNLAVRGKLVEQNAADEPAVELLQTFRTGKLELRKKTGDARIKFAEDATPSVLRLKLPSGWEVQSFENLFLFIDYRGKTPPKTDAGIPLITAKNVRVRNLNREPREFIAPDTFAKWMTRGFPRFGDIFFTTEAPLANACLNDIDEPFALAQRVVCLQPYAAINTRFLVDAMASDLVQEMIDREATGMTAKGIKTAKLKPLALPVPPLAEQHCIVAKVDVLMALCDRIETALTTADTTRTRLLEALLHEALTPVTTIPEAAE